MKKTLYLIMSDTAKPAHEEQKIVAWQPNGGAFWASRKEVIDILTNNPEFNVWPHRFAFETPEGALELAQKVDFITDKVAYKLCYIKIETPAVVAV